VLREKSYRETRVMHPRHQAEPGGRGSTTDWPDGDALGNSVPQRYRSFPETTACSLDRPFIPGVASPGSGVACQGDPYPATVFEVYRSYMSDWSQTAFMEARQVLHTDPLQWTFEALWAGPWNVYLGQESCGY
jgi:hypothetical protein